MKPPPPPRVSVVMSVYNDEDYLAASIESILRQDYTDLEFLIVDDESSDGSTAILQDYAASDDRIRLIRNERNLGLTRSLNRALSLCRGGLIARQDSDDISSPERISTQLRFLDEHPDHGLVGSSFDTLDENGEITGHVAVAESDQEIRREILFKNPFCHASMMFRRELLELASYDESIEFAQDYDLWSNYLRHTKAHNLRRPLIGYRVHANNISSRKQEAQDQSAARTAAKNIEALSGKAPDATDLEVLRRIFYGNLDKALIRTRRDHIDLYLDLMSACGSRKVGERRIAWHEILRIRKRLLRSGSLHKVRKWKVFLGYATHCIRWSSAGGETLPK